MLIIKATAARLEPRNARTRCSSQVIVGASASQIKRFATSKEVRYDMKKKVVRSSTKEVKNVSGDYGAIVKSRMRQSRAHDVRNRFIKIRRGPEIPRDCEEWYRKWSMRSVIQLSCVTSSHGDQFMLEHIDGDHIICSVSELDNIAGGRIRRWCQKRRNVPLDHETAERYGLYNDIQAAERWCVDAVVFVQEEELIRGRYGVRRLTGPKYYGHNHDEPFWGWQEIELNSLGGSGLANALAQQGIWNEGIPFRLRCEPGRSSVSIEAVDNIKVLDALDAYCYKHSGRAVRVSSPGDREKTSDTARFEKRDSEMMVCDTQLMCMQSSLANAIARVVDAPYAREKVFGESLPSMLSFSDAAAWADRNASRVELHRVHYDRSRYRGYLEYLLARTEGVFLVRLRAANVDHVISVDCAKREVLDAIERYPLVLCKESLMCCVGNPLTFERIMEMRLVVPIHRNEKSSKNKSGRAKRIKRRENARRRFRA